MWPSFEKLRLLDVVLTGGLMISCSTMPHSQGTPTLSKTTWRSFDAKEMPWRPKDVPHGKKLHAMVITVHGLSGAASDFWPLGEAWPREGIAVYGLELRGQGNDPELKKRGDIPSAKVWQRDLLTFHQLIRAKHPGVPVYWYAESLGTLIGLHALKSLPECEQPAGLMLASPAAGLKIKMSAFKNAAVKTAIAVLPWKKVNLEKLAGVHDKDIRVTANTTHEGQMAKTPHYVPEFTLRLLGHLNSMIESLPKAAAQAKQPVLVLASPNDVIASPEQITALFEDIGSKDKTILWYQNSYHLLLHDVQRAEVLGDATKWLHGHLRRH
jgi:alpha-beta hydrolase superfamily lysophospholipase